MQTAATISTEQRRNPIRFWLKVKRFELRLWWFRKKDNALFAIGNRLPPIIKYHAAISVTAEISTTDLENTVMGDIRSMEAIGLYAKRHGIN